MKHKVSIGISHRLKSIIQKINRTSITHLITKLKPIHEIQQIDNDYISTGLDPQFEIEVINKELPRGKYIISYSGSYKGSFLSPLVYLDDGFGYRQNLSFHLHSSAGNVVETEILIPFPIKKIRIDPIDKEGEFTFDQLKFERAHFSLTLLRIIIKKVKNNLQHPIQFIRKVYFYYFMLKKTETSTFNNLIFIHSLQELNLRSSSSYINWIQNYDTLTAEKCQHMKKYVEQFKYKPLISVIMPVYNAPINYLQEAIESVCDQIYPNWELCIADDASTNPKIRKLLNKYQNDPRIKIAYRQQNGHISASSNSALSLAQGDYIALLDHDDLLTKDALFWVADAINKNPDVQLIYSDEDKLDQSGMRFDAYFKSDWNYDLFLSQNMISHLGVYKTSLVHAVGQFRLGFEGSQDYDLALRCIECLTPAQIYHIPKVLYHWRVLPGSTALSANEKSYAEIAGQKALQEHLDRTGVSGSISPSPQIKGMFRVSYNLPQEKPSVTIIIPTRDKVDLLKTCIKSIFEKSTYTNFKISIVDNGSVESKTFSFFETLPKDRVNIIKDSGDFNFSRLNNQVVKACDSEYVCLLNNDIEVLTPQWLEEMLGHAIQPKVGAVGARLWYPNKTLQHGGVVTGLGGIASHAHSFISKHHQGYFGRGVLQQSFSAVTAACLLIKRNVYQEIDGLDEQLAVAFNDVDFCLRLKQAGYRNVWTPYAELIHYESASRGSDMSSKNIDRFLKEISFMEERWKDRLSQDPAYNPNLTLQSHDFSLAWPPRMKFDIPE